ncbi:hypothetical protein D3C81_1722410 [compost metagenome]
MIILAPRYRVFTISTRCCSPTDSCQMGRSTGNASPKCSASSSISLHLAFIHFLPRQKDAFSPSTMFSAAVSVWTSLKFWNTIPTPNAAASLGERIFTGFPRMIMSPSSAR